MASVATKVKAATPKPIDPAAAKFAAFNKQSTFTKTSTITDMFAKANTAEQFKNASDHWSQVRDEVRKAEEKLSCEDYESSDKQLIFDAVEDLISKPIGLILSTLAMLISFAGREEEQLIKDLKDVSEELALLAIDKVTGKVSDKMGDELKKKVGGPLRESLLRYLQKVSKRSRKHFAQILDNLAGTAKAVGSTAMTTAKIALTPSKIAPDLCASVGSLDKARGEAAQRIFKLPPVSSMPDFSKMPGAGPSMSPAR